MEGQQLRSVKTIHLVFACAFFVLLISGVMVLHQLKERTSATEWLVHTYQVIYELKDSRLELTEAQEQLQRYLNAQDQRSLRDFHQSIQSTQKEFDDVQQLTHDNPAQQARLHNIAKSLVNFADLTKNTLNPVKSSPAFIHKNIAVIEQTMTQLERVIQTMVAEELALLKLRNTRVVHERSLNFIWILVSSSIGYLFILLAYLALIRLARNNEKQQRQLQQMNDEQIHQLEMQRKELEFSLSSGKLGFWNLDLETHEMTRSLIHDQIFGYKTLLPEWTYEQFLTHVHPEDVQMVDTSFKTAVAHHQVLALQCRIYRADDKRLSWIEISAKRVKIGGKTCMLGLVQDITDSKSMELKLRQISREVDSLLEGAPDGLVICDQSGHITYVNALTLTLFGYQREEMIGQTIEFLMPTRYREEHVKHRHGYFKSPYIRPMGGKLNLSAQHRDGHEFPVEINLSPIESSEGLRVIAAIRDVTDRKHLLDLLAESELRWKYALESGNQGVWDWYVPEKVIYFSSTWKQMLGYQDDEIQNLQSEFESLVHPDDLAKVWQAMNDHFNQKTSEYVCEVRFRCKDGHYKWILDRGKVIERAPDGAALRAIGTHTDITALKIQEEKLKHIAEHDPLTGLINRAFFEDRLLHALEAAKRHGELVAVLFVDIDNFKQVNDRYGHVFGDALLCAVANCLKKCIRASDTLARFGGDEFVLLLSEFANENDVVIVVEKINQCLSKSYEMKEIKINVTLSIGIAVYPCDGMQLLIEKADTAMYYVKNHGRGNYKRYDESLGLKK